ncbi:MAG TPA: tetratricopeptide repeat protein [Opitutaceae bacterium]|nr:tetratricopeptide repeat protein [Opitutaceae bacterium]
MSRSLAFAAACLLVLAAYARTLGPNALELAGAGASRAYYNLLVEGFRAGRLSLAREVPAGLAALPDPYDPRASERFRVGLDGVHDLTLYRGRFYLYFGAVPALLLFWPWAALTGGYLSHALAVWLGCAAGFLAAAGLVRGLWRRHFAGAPAWVAAGALLAFGLADGALVLLQRPEVWEVPIACAHALVLLSLAALWAALHQENRRALWTAAASLAYGLALGARPSLLFGAAILLVPLGMDRGRPGRAGRLLAAAALPLALCGLGLAWYNLARFHSALEFGQRYQLAADRQDGARHFSAGYLWFNFRLYFLEAPRLGGAFPFLRPHPWPEAPPGHGPVEDPFGILPQVPLALLALAAPLAWRGRSAAEADPLRRFALALALLFGSSALLFCLFYGATSRYEFEFLPELLLLAAFGILGLDRALAARPALRRWARAGWACLLAVSLAGSGLQADLRAARTRLLVGSVLSDAGKTEAGLAQLRLAVRLAPGLAEAHNNLANAQLRAGRPAEAEAEYAEAIHLDPAAPGEHYNLGNLLVREGRAAEAALEYQAALRLDPRYAPAHYNLAVALFRLGRPAEAEAHLREAVRLRPDMDPARRQPAPTP